MTTQSQIDLDPKNDAHLMSHALAPVASQLAELNQIIRSFIPTESETSHRIIDHVFAAGGKRIRPALFFMGCRLVAYQGTHLLPMGAVAEFVHTASLLHDDVVDSSTLRRNKPTANSIWGDEAAVLVGDLIYARASEMMTATGSLELVSSYAQAIRLMSEGELLQLENVYNADASETVYLRIIECKTAALIATACKSAGLLAGASRAACEALEQFGRNVGIAFQLIDDALDYAGLTELFGKPTLTDLAEGKVTMPIILLRHLATPDELKKMNAMINALNPDAESLQWIAALVDRYDTAEKTIARAKTYTDNAMRALDVFPDSPERRDLLDMAESLVLRFN